MMSAPKWFLPVVILAWIWNLLGCAAFLSDVTLTREDLAKMSPAHIVLLLLARKASARGWIA